MGYEERLKEGRDRYEADDSALTGIGQNTTEGLAATGKALSNLEDLLKKVRRHIDSVKRLRSDILEAKNRAKTASNKANQRQRIAETRGKNRTLNQARAKEHHGHRNIQQGEIVGLVEKYESLEERIEAKIKVLQSGGYRRKTRRK